jgi:hypothetical protein
MKVKIEPKKFSKSGSKQIIKMALVTCPILEKNAIVLLENCIHSSKNNTF